MSDACRIPIKPLGIGEVALRVSDLRRSIAFYCETLGFTLVGVLPDSIAFIRVADGVEGHTHVIGLFSREPAGERRRPNVGRVEPPSLDASSLRYRDFAE